MKLETRPSIWGVAAGALRNVGCGREELTLGPKRGAF